MENLKSKFKTGPLSVLEWTMSILFFVWLFGGLLWLFGQVSGWWILLLAAGGFLIAYAIDRLDLKGSTVAIVFLLAAICVGVGLYRSWLELHEADWKFYAYAGAVILATVLAYIYRAFRLD